MKPPGDSRKKSKEKGETDMLKKQFERLAACPYCQNVVEFIWVHGHYQCPRCKNIVVGCCGDE